jgi:hypothetical protein
VRRVELLIDGGRVGSFRNGPYGGTLDTTQLRNGTYTFTARAVGSDGTSVSASIQVTVANP